MTTRRSSAPRAGSLDYAQLARFRYALRRFLRFSEDAARQAGISPGQYQLLLFVRGFRPGLPTVTDLAERLQVRHQSAVGLIDRCGRAGLVKRQTDAKDARRVRISLTPRGTRTLERLVSLHVGELARFRKAVPALRALTARARTRS